jgi:hypothetical protein
MILLACKLKLTLKIDFNITLEYSRFDREKKEMCMSSIRMFVLSTFALLSPSLALADNGDAKAAAQSYLQGGQGIVDTLNSAAPDYAAVLTGIDQMLENAKPVARAFAVLHPQCADQIAALIDLYPQINTWTALQIRNQIEIGDALPAADGCYAARDIVAHPAITRALIRAGNPQPRRLLREMNEGIEHMQEIAGEL